MGGEERKGGSSENHETPSKELPESCYGKCNHKARREKLAREALVEVTWGGVESRR
jgi:hypothetical protein